ncbi:MAG TPA: phospholipase D-like domain-containing protein [Gemmatimonadaceae bacterium]
MATSSDRSAAAAPSDPPAPTPTVPGSPHLPLRTDPGAPVAPPLRQGPIFARGLWRIAAAEVSGGNHVGLLRDGPATFDAMIAAIEGARDTVDLESYIIRGDEVGTRFAAALAAAVGRGVRARVIVDWIGMRGEPRRFFAGLRASGVALQVFNAPGFRPWLGLVPRDHRKLLVADGHVGITGGVGLGREWLTGVQKRRRSRWRDTAVRIEGPAAHDMARAFEHMWWRARWPRERRSAARDLRGRPASACCLADPEPGEALVGIVEGEPGRLRVARALQVQAVQAERSIWIASAYFVPSFAEIEALTGAARDGIDVRVLVPSRYDHPWIRRLTRRFYRRLQSSGVRIWEWQGEMMHAKTSVVDGRFVRVGSTDFNPLGVAINFELDAVIEERAVAAEAEAMFLDDLAQSREIKVV